MDPKAIILIQEADAALETASQERLRPEEDVVAYSICHKSRESIRLYLESYLLKHGVKSDATSTINDLLAHCAEINPAFGRVDVAEVQCRGARTDRNEYCLSVGQVTNCFEAASEVSKLIHSIS